MPEREPIDVIAPNFPDKGVKLCPTCPRATGQKNERKGLLGLLGKKTTTWHESPMGSKEIAELATNGMHGIFYAEDSISNTGTVLHLTKDNLAFYLEQIAKCEGPSKDGNACSALHMPTGSAIQSMDCSMESGEDYRGNPGGLVRAPIRINPQDLP